MAYILLLEPNTLLADVYTRILEQSGHTVCAAHSAQAAIYAADERTPDGVILELQLPAHGGIEFLHEFRSYPEWQAIPVIVHTMLPPPRLLSFADPLRTNLGVATVLYKPTTTLADLCRAVRAAVVPA